MPALVPGDLVLVTGASGYLGTRIVKTLAEQGFRVRGTVRDDAKAAFLRSLAPGIEAVVVGDMREPGAYNIAAAGVDGIIHAASPLDVMNPGAPELVIGPAVAGVQAILDAIPPTLKRIVQISSLGAVSADSLGGTPGQYGANDWNTASVDICAKEGKAAPDIHKYLASKTLAEKAFWDFFKVSRAYDGVVLAPGLIMGPSIDWAASRGQNGGSTFWAFWEWLQPGKTEADLKTETWNIVDVRDTAAFALRALTTPEAGGKRILLAAGPMHDNDKAIAVNRFITDAGLEKGNSDPEFRAALRASAVQFDGSKATELLKLEYRDTDATLADTVLSILEVRAKGAVAN